MVASTVFALFSYSLVLVSCQTYVAQDSVVSIKDIYNRHQCTGALISKNWVVTSAQCIKGKPPNYFYILTEDSQMYNVSQVIPHPTFQETTRKHDIGLLKLSVNITLPDFVISCSQPPPNVEIRIYGRGTYFGVESLVFLQEAYGRTLRDFDCKRIFPSLSSKEYCAASPWHCSIESGSPILSQGKLIGVVGAIRNPCSNDPFIYTKLNESWIRMQNSNFRCDYV